MLPGSQLQPALNRNPSAYPAGEQPPRLSGLYSNSSGISSSGSKYSPIGCCGYAMSSADPVEMLDDLTLLMQVERRLTRVVRLYGRPQRKVAARGEPA
jgi:hypothetical protein